MTQQIIVPWHLCQQVPNDGTLQDKFLNTIDQNGLVAADKIADLHDDIRNGLTELEVEYTIVVRWPGSVVIEVDPAFLVPIQLRWPGHGLIFRSV
jgi:hypothetical protein